MREYKIVILGDGGVGKSEDSYRHQARIDDEPAHLDILDTAGQPEFTAMRDQYMRTGAGYIICYSVTDKRSLPEAIQYKKLVDRVRNCENIPVVLVGNKCDLEEHRKVKLEEGQSLACQWGCPFFETSAALRQFVDEAFHGLVREIRRIEKEALAAVEKQNQANRSPGKKIKDFFKGRHLFKRR